MGTTYCKITQNLEDQVIVITGANTGIGKICAEELAKQKGTIVLACRSQERTLPAIQEIQKNVPQAKVEFMKLDLSDLDSVLEFSKQFKAKYSKLNILLNNAGVMAVQNREVSKQGYELQFATNYLGHFVLTNQLLPLIKNTPKSRIVNVSSAVHGDWPMMGGKGDIHFDDLQQEKDYDPFKTYQQTKLANILFSKYLQKLLDEQKQEVKVVSLHPGVINTELSRHIYENKTGFQKFKINAFYFFTKTPFQGSQTSLQCCLEDFDKLQAGKYYSDCKEVAPSDFAQDPERRDKLWEVTNKLMAKYLQPW